MTEIDSKYFFLVFCLYYFFEIATRYYENNKTLYREDLQLIL